MFSVNSVLNNCPGFFSALGGGHLLSVVYRCVNKNGEKGYSFRAGQCAALSSLKKCYFCRTMVCVLQILGLQEVAEVRG